MATSIESAQLEGDPLIDPRGKQLLSETLGFTVEAAANSGGVAEPTSTRIRSKKNKVKRDKSKRKSSGVKSYKTPYIHTICDVPEEIPYTSFGSNITVSIAVPASIVNNAQSQELKSYLVGQIARTLTVFSVHEVVVYADDMEPPSTTEASALRQSLEKNDHASNLNAVSDRKPLMNRSMSRAQSYFIKNLEYLETPQYLRRSLFPMQHELKFAGLQNPLDAPHHLRKYQILPYREGVVLPRRGACQETGSKVNCGLDQAVRISEVLQEGVRVTLKLSRNTLSQLRKIGRPSNDTAVLTGKLVSSRDPWLSLGLYWGYTCRAASDLAEAVTFCPFSSDGKYDLIMGTSERGENVLEGWKMPKFKHLLLVFGGLQGLEPIIEELAKNKRVAGFSVNYSAANLFDKYINVCPYQTSRTIRTEEALICALALLRPHIVRLGNRNQ